MKKVLITGEAGFSLTVRDYLEKNGISAETVSIFGSDWKKKPFGGFDAIIAVAGVVPREGVKPEDFYSVNTEKTKELAEKAKDEGVGHFVFISSMAVYGLTQRMNSSDGTVTADTECKPETDYGKSKLLAEEALEKLKDESFTVVNIRVPSIYGRGKTEYTDQYKYLADKLPVIPVCFTGLKKSAISVENLCEVIKLAALDRESRTVCPDDGAASAFDFCTAIYPEKKKSRFAGLLIELLLKNNARILDYYGAVCYSPELSEVYNGAYRTVSLKEGIRKAYEK